ncbi:MAG: hypothetical protein WBG62_08075, partial [Cyclobacteriaceae bacterium]
MIRLLFILSLLSCSCALAQLHPYGLAGSPYVIASALPELPLLSAGDSSVFKKRPLPDSLSLEGAAAYGESELKESEYYKA